MLTSMDQFAAQKKQAAIIDRCLLIEITPKTYFTNSSAICTAFNAAPLSN